MTTLTVFFMQRYSVPSAFMALAVTEISPWMKGLTRAGISGRTKALKPLGSLSP